MRKKIITALFLLFLTGCFKPPPGMVLIPGGNYIIGSSEIDTDERAVELGIVDAWFESEKPGHKVKLDPFFIDTYEITNENYKEFIDAVWHIPPRPTRRGWRGREFNPRYAREPVVFVTWEDAVYYCHWAGKYLPTEQEWEAAARGPQGYIYPWGNEFELEKANVGGKKMGPVDTGSYEKNQFGAYDMVGNVWEWTASWYKPYDGSSFKNTNYGEKKRVIRGNSWSSVGHYSPEDELDVIKHNSRASFRLFLKPKGITNDLGFRCVKPVDSFIERMYYKSIFQN